MIRGRCRLLPSTTILAFILVVAGSAVAGAQDHAPGERGSSNVQVLGHLPLGSTPWAGQVDIKTVELEQEVSRPYAYVARRRNGFNIISVKDPHRPEIIYAWDFENAALNRGGASSATYLKIKGRYYFSLSTQFGAQGPNNDLGAVLFDVTGLPDTSKVKEAARIHEKQYPGGFHEEFAYKHSSGQSLLFATTVGPFANVYDIEKLLAGDPNQGLVGKIPHPGSPFGTTPALGVQTYVTRSIPGYHAFYVGYDPATHQDRMYGAGATGYYVFDVTRLEEPKLLASVTGVPGVSFGHTFQPTPDGRYGLTDMESQYAPILVFDLKPALDGKVQTISRPIGAWTARWQGLPHNVEIRWPYAFVAAYEDGLQVINLMDPTNPYTVGFYDTYDGPYKLREDASTALLGTAIMGAWGVRVRNADGLIVVDDHWTGFWAFKMDGFDGWNGHQWGMPNNSTAQDWDNGPDGAPRPARISSR